ncbi:uncharacterized protein LOC119079535 [Bradysia coprophila]|uniref:uncharacterized protein LOC119079535 n=1 Tax=Bradysia coprophila TaxID=38358 RepID=UPI00187DD8D7|nr:uncharacterized protein LOC119079535 [Bradysia coprophila]
MFRSTISILRSLEPLQLMSQRSMTGMKNKKNPFAKEKLPPLTAMETITSRDRDLETLVQTHLTSRKVKHGDYDFSECNEGYILCYINTLQRKKEPQNVFYGVFYGEDHPLNLQGPVKGIQTLLHGKDTAILNAIRNFPKIEAKQLCICTDCTRTIGMMRRLPEYSENGYRMSAGRILERKDTYEQLTAAVRLRDDLKLRIMYTPADVIIKMRRAMWLATLASRAEIEQQ